MSINPNPTVHSVVANNQIQTAIYDEDAAIHSGDVIVAPTVVAIVLPHGFGFVTVTQEGCPGESYIGAGTAFENPTNSWDATFWDAYCARLGKISPESQTAALEIAGSLGLPVLPVLEDRAQWAVSKAIGDKYGVRAGYRLTTVSV